MNHENSFFFDVGISTPVHCYLYNNYIEQV